MIPRRRSVIIITILHTPLSHDEIGDGEGMDPEILFELFAQRVALGFAVLEEVKAVLHQVMPPRPRKNGLPHRELDAFRPLNTRQQRDASLGLPALSPRR